MMHDKRKLDNQLKNTETEDISTYVFRRYFGLFGGV